MIVVKFLQKHAIYSIGETAGFRQDVADRLIATGLAEFVKEVDNRGKEKKAEKKETTEEAKIIKPRGTKKDYVTK